MRIHSPKMTNAEATGSFSGSFTGVGNFEGLTADSVAYENVTGKPTLISGSEQVTISGTTGFSSFSSSVESSISVEKGRVDAILNASSADKDSFKEIVDLINTVDTENDTAFAGYVTSSGNRLTALESSVANLDNTYATDVALSNASGALDTSIKANASAIANLDNNYATDSQLTTVSSSLKGEIADNKSNIAANATAISNLDTDYASDAQLTSVSGALDTNIKANASAIAGLDSTYATDTSVSSAVSGLSGSAHTQRKAIESSLNGKINTEKSRVTANASAIAGLDSTYATDVSLSNSIAALSGSAHDQRIVLDSEQSTEITSAVSTLSGSAHIQRKTIEAAAATNTGKLAGIEAGATADQTASEILTAIKTVDGSGSGLDADKLDGQSSAFYATATSVSTHTARTDNPHSVTKAQVGLGNVSNESRSTLLNNSALTGTATAPTQLSSDDSTKVATTAFVQDRVDEVIGTAGAALDTLGELSASLASDQSGLASLTTTVGTKLAKASNLSDLANAGTARTNLGLGSAAVQNSGAFATSVQGSTADSAIQPDDLASVATSGAYGDLSGKPTTITTTQRDAIVNNSAKQTNVSTNLSATASGTSLVVKSSDGTNASLPAATTTAWGVMTDEDKTKLDNIEAGATADQTATEILDALKTVDGAGSGLDADKLDGQTSTYFGTAANVSTNASNISTNTTKLAGIEAGATADQSATEILTALKTVDGSGSGLDADKLDGQSSAYFGTAADVSTNTADIATNTGKLAGIEAGATADQTATEILTALKTVDGSGSGLDADKLDGQTSTYFGTAANVSTNASNISANASAISTINAKDPVLTITGDVSGTATFTNLGNATLTAVVADDSHNHTIANVDGLQTALNAKQAAGTYNTIIGTDTDVDTSGATVIDNIYMTDAVITSHGTRTLTLANLGYTGAANANYITNNNQLTNGAGYITSYVNTVDMGDGFKIANSAGTDQFTVTENEEIRFAGGGATSVAFDAATQKVTISSTDTNTVYTHPGFSSDDISIDTGALTGATVISDLDFNVTTNSEGHVTDANGTVSTRNLTLGDLGYTGATNANYITNNNQLTNGAGYQTTSGTVSYATSAGNAATVDGKNASDFFNDGDTHLSMANGDGIVWDDTTNQMFVRKDGSDYELYSTDNLSLSTLGYTGATNANRITNNNQISNGAGYQTAAQVSTAVSAIVDSAPATLDTLNELAAALGDDANFATTMTTALANKQAAGTYNTVIGTDTDVNTSGANIIDNIYMTDGVITSHGTRALTLGDLGYTGAANANYITNNNQLTNGASYLTTSGKAADSNLLDGLDLAGTRANVANKVVRTDGSGYANFGWINTTSGNTTDAITDWYVNTNDGYIRKATKSHVLSQLGIAAGATNVTNNNQLTNGAGYITSYTDTNTTYSAGRGLDLNGTTFNLETDLRDSISYIGYDANDYIEWSNNAWTRTVVAGTERLRVDTSGIDVSGRIVADADITAYSDERLKKDIKTIEGALDKTKALRGVEFTRIADDSKSIGVVAQELEEILPELVLTDDEGMKSVNYAQITGLLIEAVKELSAKVDKLENK